MPFKVRNLDVERLFGSLPPMFSDPKIPVKVKWDLAKLQNKVEDASRPLNKAKKGIVERYCAKDENSRPVLDKGNYTFPDNDPSSYIKEREEFMELESEIESYKPKIDLSTLPLESWSASDLVILGPFVEFIEPAPAGPVPTEPKK